MTKAKGTPGRPRVVHNKIILELKLPDEFLSRQDADRISKARIIGAATTAAGVYLMVDLVGVLGKSIREAAAPVPAWLAVLSPGVFLINFFRKTLTGEQPEPVPKGFKPNWLGIALGTIAGGMVVAGLNPGVILSGIGDIIDGLIPG